MTALEPEVATTMRVLLAVRTGITYQLTNWAQFHSAAYR